MVRLAGFGTECWCYMYKENTVYKDWFNHRFSRGVRVFVLFLGVESVAPRCTKWCATFVQSGATLWILGRWTKRWIGRQKDVEERSIACFSCCCNAFCFLFLIPGLPFLGLGGVFDVAVGLALGLCCWSLVLGPGSVILVLWSLSLVFLVLVFGFFYTLLMCIATALP